MTGELQFGLSFIRTTTPCCYIVWPHCLLCPTACDGSQVSDIYKWPSREALPFMMFTYPVGPRWLVTPNRISNTQWATQPKLHLQVIIVPEWFCDFSAASTPSTGQPQASKLPTRAQSRRQTRLKQVTGEGRQCCSETWATWLTT